MNTTNILDTPVPETFKSPVLKPTPYKQIVIPKLKKLVLNVSAKAQKRINDFADWIMNIPIKTKVKSVRSALKGFTESYEVDVVENDPLKHLNVTKKDVRDKLQFLLNKMNGLKSIITLKIFFEKLSKEEVIIKEAFFNSKAIIILNKDDIDKMLQSSTNQIIEKIGNWLKEGSGWTIKILDSHFINIVQYSPLGGSSYVQLPEELRNFRKGLINIKNNDNECFRWCHLAKVYCNQIKSNRERISHYKKYVNTLNYDGIKFPVSIKQISKIEQQNNTSINVFGYEAKSDSRYTSLRK